MKFKRGRLLLDKSNMTNDSKISAARQQLLLVHCKKKKNSPEARLQLYMIFYFELCGFLSFANDIPEFYQNK